MLLSSLWRIALQNIGIPSSVIPLQPQLLVLMMSLIFCGYLIVMRPLLLSRFSHCLWLWDILTGMGISFDCVVNCAFLDMKTDFFFKLNLVNLNLYIQIFFPAPLYRLSGISFMCLFIG